MTTKARRPSTQGEIQTETCEGALNGPETAKWTLAFCFQLRWRVLLRTSSTAAVGLCICASHSTCGTLAFDYSDRSALLHASLRLLTFTKPLPCDWCPASERCPPGVVLHTCGAILVHQRRSPSIVSHIASPLRTVISSAPSRTAASGRATLGFHHRE